MLIWPLTIVILGMGTGPGSNLFLSHGSGVGDPACRVDFGCFATRPSEPSHQRTKLQPCESGDVDHWVTDLRDRVLARDRLVLYAIERYGEPIRCDGTVTSAFGGESFGNLVLGFSEGASYRIEVMPPEAQIVELEAPMGFDVANSAIELMRAYAEEVGVEIDWTTPTARTFGDRQEETYWDPDDGLNASVTFTYRSEALIAVRFSLAL